MINNDTELFNMMMKDLERVMLKTSEKVLNRWRELIQEFWYDAHPESVYYNRTYEFLESLTSTGLIKLKDGFEVVLFFDRSAMTIARNGEFWQHIQRYKLPELIDEGYTVFGKKEFEGAHSLDRLIDELREKDYFISEIRRQFAVTINVKLI